VSELVTLAYRRLHENPFFIRSHRNFVQTLCE
jgi:hypothetical protein